MTQYAEKNDQVTIALMGDVMLGRGVNEALQDMKPEEPWSDLLPLLHTASTRIANLECAITTHKRKWGRTEKVFHFRADPSAVKVLKVADINACSLANNHILDFEDAGLLDTIRYLDEAGICHSGAGKTLADANRPATWQTPEGFSIALLAMTDNEPSFAATNISPGTSYVPVSVDLEILNGIEKRIANARKSGADIVVFSNHWGGNFVQHPSNLFRDFAHAVMDLGADIYHGHSAHVFHGIEIYHGKPIFYDTGDMIDDYAVYPWPRNDWSFLFMATFDRHGLLKLELHPVSLEFALVKLAQGEIRDRILEHMQDLSEEFGTKLEKSDNHLTWIRADQ